MVEKKPEGKEHTTIGFRDLKTVCDPNTEMNGDGGNNCTPTTLDIEIGRRDTAGTDASRKVERVMGERRISRKLKKNTCVSSAFMA